jgi:hypothetical protein
MTRKTPRPTPSAATPPTPKPTTSKLTDLRARYAQSVRGKEAAKANASTKPRKRAPKKKTG